MNNPMNKNDGTTNNKMSRIKKTAKLTLISAKELLFPKGIVGFSLNTVIRSLLYIFILTPFLTWFTQNYGGSLLAVTPLEILFTIVGFTTTVSILLIMTILIIQITAAIKTLFRKNTE